MDTRVERERRNPNRDALPGLRYVMNELYCTWTQTRHFDVIVNVIEKDEFERQKAVTQRFHQYGYHTKQINLEVTNGDVVYIHARSSDAFEDETVIKDVCQHIIDSGLGERQAK